MTTPLERLIRSRRSIRRFKPEPVERGRISACLEAARLAPSAENAQPWRFVVVDEPVLKERLAEAAFSGIYRMTRFAAQAPVLVVVLASLDLVAHKIGRHIQGTQYYLIDIGIAGEHFVLRAEEEGLATCWIGWFNARRVRKLLGVPRRYKIVAMVAVGIAASRPPADAKRRPLDAIVGWNGLP